MILSKAAIAKVKAIMAEQRPEGNYPAALRIGVQGGGCSGFSYVLRLEREATPGPMDKKYDFDGLIVLIDGTSGMYLEGATMDWVEDEFKAGFKFENPNVKSTCGCGESFNA
jgi:iron-sulfur cluster assembly accessory protein